MKFKKRFLYCLLLTIFIYTAAACSREASTTTTPEVQSAVHVVVTPAVQEELSKPVILSDEHRSGEGGFSFSTIPGYSLEDFWGYVNMEAPDATEELGPFIVMIGSSLDEDRSLDQHYAETIGTFDSSVNIHSKTDIKVAGYPGMLVDIGGLSDDGQEMKGRVTLVSIGVRHNFFMLGTSTAARWDEELGPYFDAVLKTLSFFEPSTPTVGAVEDNPLIEIGGENIRQWAVYAEASSEYSDSRGSVSQATGQPNTLECGNAPTAWASETNGGIEWIDLYYLDPVIPTNIVIYQSFFPDQVVEVGVIDWNDWYYPVYTSEPRLETECPYELYVPVDGIDFAVIGVRVKIDQSNLSPNSWNQIDAVELNGYALPDPYTGSAELPYEPVGDSPEPISSYYEDFLSDIDPEELDLGTFFYLIEPEDEEMVYPGEGRIQYQSTSREYVIGLISKDNRQSLSIFLPVEAGGGFIELNPYNASSPLKGYSASLYIGPWLYGVVEGILDLEIFPDQTITGRFFMEVQGLDKPSETYYILGAFNQIPLR